MYKIKIEEVIQLKFCLKYPVYMYMYLLKSGIYDYIGHGLLTKIFQIICFLYFF